jgi:hypothetical protein
LVKDEHIRNPAEDRNLPDRKIISTWNVTLDGGMLDKDVMPGEFAK